MSRPLKKMGFVESFSIFIFFTLLMLFLTRYAIPYFSKISGQESILFWFIVAGLGVFLPLIILAIVILQREGFKFSKETWTQRMRFRKLTRNDLIWAIVGMLVIMILSWIVMAGLEWALGSFDHSPPFMSFEALSPGRYWLLAVWAPYWILNIMGEEILWRGVMLPRQEVSFGKKTWIIHAFGWWLFHFAFGWHLLITLIPIIFIQSYVVQKTKNSWTGVIIHGGINGPSFIAISFGLI